MTSFNEWFQAMILVEKIFWLIAIPFSVVFIIQLISTFFLGDIDEIEAGDDVDANIDGDVGIGFQFITFKNLVAFFTIFGWTGITCLDSGMAVGTTIIISFVAGVIMMSIMASIVYFMGKLTHDGTLKLSNAIGKVGSVYLFIPAKRSGLGKVQINVQGYRTLDAMTDNEEDIKTGSVIEVLDILNDDILLVNVFNN